MSMMKQIDLAGPNYQPKVSYHLIFVLVIKNTLIMLMTFYSNAFFKCSVIIADLVMELK